MLVVQGVLGSGKTQLLTRMRTTFRYRRAWLSRDDVDARLDLSGDLAPEPEQVLGTLRRQLARNSSFWRRAGTPRFDLVQGALAAHRVRLGQLGPPPSATAADLKFLFSNAGRVTAALESGGLPLIVPSRKAGPLRWARQAQVKLGISKSAKWVKEHLQGTSGSDLYAERERETLRSLERSLCVAMAADLAHANGRRRLGLGQIAIFVDAYDRIEAESTNKRWLVEFADDLRAAGARVVLTIACRSQSTWTERLQDDPDHGQLGAHTVSATVEIVPLQPLPWPEREIALRLYGINDHGLLQSLAQVSHGHPLFLGLLGTHFGRGEAPRPGSREHALLAELPKLGRRTDFDDEWVRSFLAAMAPLILDGLAPRLQDHARAAASLRTFDRGVLAHVMEERFSDKRFGELRETGLLGPPRQSGLFPKEESFRVKGFVREALANDDADTGARDVWHARAREYYDAAAMESFDPERQFALGAEALRHRFFGEPEAAAEQYVRAFVAELDSGRFDRCEVLLDVAASLPPRDRNWRARVAAFAGRTYLADNRYELAEQRLEEARQLVEDPVLELAIAHALAKCQRLRGRYTQARGAVAVMSRARDRHPVATFAASWQLSLVAKAEGKLTEASATASEAESALRALLGLDDRVRNQAQWDIGLSSLDRKRAHLLRHQADLARRGGDYRLADELVVQAQESYASHPESVAQQHLAFLRSHLLRARGATQEASAVAEGVMTWSASQEVPDRRTVVAANRALAQASLIGSEPQRAKPFLEMLVAVEAEIYPGGAVIGHWGLGELARIGGVPEDARDHYGTSIRIATEHGVVVEKLYAQFGLAEVERDQDAPEKAAKRLARFRASHLLDEHPLLEFWWALLAARAATDSVESRQAEDHFLRAERAVGRLLTPDGAPTPETALLDKDRADALRGARFAALVPSLL